VDLFFTGAEVPAIIRYLRNSHRFYSEEVYPGITEIISRMSSDGETGEIMMIEQFFTEYLAEVRNHFDYEEQTVFPYIIHLHDRITGSDQTQSGSDYSVAEYRDHHDDIEEKLDDLRNLLIEYLPLRESQPVRRRLLFRLHELEHDLKIHSRIEEQILIPLVACMETRLKESQ
jgi:regulator of cell morphogenesis and NO signaling